MKFNTVIFYDIENLLKGYSFSQQMIANLSLEEILESIRKTEKLGQIAVQRAYANWSDSRLSVMRGEINELGIDPIQVFGFSREQKKNAADIQLAIDAIDLAHVRPSLEVFVIVSGDGGFAALAKKLHEYGKTVIGCAYRNATNKTFQAVCDDFVWITDPDEEEHQYRASFQTLTIKQSDGFDPRNSRLINQVKRTTSSSSEDIVVKTKEILNWYASDRFCQSDLARSGIYLSVIQQAISYIIPGLQPIQLGFARFIEYMQYVCQGSELCIARIPPSQVILALRSSVPKGSEVLPDLNSREIHSVDTYRSILASGSPIYRLPSPEDLYAISNWIVRNPVRQVDLGTAIEEIVTALSGEISSEIVKFTLFSFISAEMFIREPEGVHVSEQKLSFRDDIQSLETVIRILKTGVMQKINTILPSVNEEVLRQILPDAS
ncbi:NYN domain-containing protein [Nostoc sp. TCL26-01]|uniref:NYN domain-containing protein n=1 Tax=Nostoc sp. TCL26-01 TaxID=2576904 RepID=UPI0015BF4B88|nr:NYN domain-containing protein [Nostoc sp. TCL26-01]QLE54844.1 NYN domain-containing protein [Nostoc sp. TCL26-01]